MNFTQQLWSVKEWGRVMATGSEYVSIVHEATNEEKWGPTGPQMEAVCNAYPRGGQEILSELRSRLNNRDKAWRPCYKSLLVLDYLARNVADRYLPEICALVPLLRTISTSFYYTNPKGIDHGVSVRERAKKLAELLSDGLQLREERVVAAQTKEKLAHNASAGGGPNNYGAYGGAGSAYGGGYDRYGGGGGGGGRDRYGGGERDRYGGGGDRDRYGGGGRAEGYDSYRPASSSRDAYGHTAASSRPRTKEEQERYDMEMALRMQRDEERRAGVSAEQLEEMYANKVRQRKGDEQRQRAAADDDEALARRLQEEEETRARREGRSLPTLNSDRPSSTAAKTPSPAPAKAAALPAPEPPKPKQPETNALDDLFAPAPVAPQPAAPAKAADPFDAFLDARGSAGQQPPQQQQSNPWGQPSQPAPPQQQQQQNPWGQPAAPPANSGWGQPAAPQPQQPSNPWGQPAQPASPPANSGWGQSAAPASPPANSGWGQPSQSSSAPPQHADPWGQPQQAPPAPQQQQQQPSNPWGQPAAPQQQQPSNPWGQPAQPAAPSPSGWDQPQQPQQQQWNQPPQQQMSGSWGQPAPQQPANSGWGQPSAPPMQASGNWGQPPAAATTTARLSNNNGSASEADNMWGTLNQFTNQQQRKQ